MHALFEEYAHRYDLHTPPNHYQHDHAFVIARVLALAPRPSMLDVGCGTGILLEKALAAGIDARGIDAAEGMVAAARRRVGASRAHWLAMQKIDEHATVDAVVSLSWTLNYARGEAELAGVLGRLLAALRPGGLLIAQIAHAGNVDGEWMEDVERGPGGDEDVRFRYRFRDCGGRRLEASYRYRCVSLGEELAEDHLLEVADAPHVADLARSAGFDDVTLLESWREEPFERSPSPFVIARAP